jgi:hypothetical protein
MDGVLVEPRAYHLALQKTVSLVGKAVGFPGVELQASDITSFESSGISSEWDSAAICAALTLTLVWKVDQHRRLPYSLHEAPPQPLVIAPPDFHKFAVLLGRTDLKSLRPLARAAHLLMEEGTSLTPDQQGELKSILSKARQINGSLTHRLFQEMILGSQVFEEVYRLSPLLDSESFLLAYDRPALSNDECSKLREWSGKTGNRIVIFTSRPSRAPQGAACTPEAEIGAQLVGLEQTPIAGLGGLLWLSQQLGADVETFLKPDPVHTLFALGLAMGREQNQCLESAARFSTGVGEKHFWEDLKRAEVLVFEDTAGGISSVSSAKKLLSKAGVRIKTRYFGITSDEVKGRSLKEYGAEVFPTLAAALKAAKVIM